MSSGLYLDYNATSPLSKSVISWLESGDFHFANPSSQHTSGKSSRKSVNESRSAIFRTFSLNEKNHSLFFHSGATEAINSFAHSFEEWTRLHKKKLLICYSKVDHLAVTTLHEQYFGPHVQFMELERDSHLHYLIEKNAAMIAKKKSEDPDLVILVHHLWVHNETGLVSPLSDLLILKKIPDLYIHVDSVQAPGKTPEWRELEFGDVWSFSAHKFGALKGIGFTFFKSETPFLPFITGGGQQQNFRSGTENPMGVMSIALALQDLCHVDIKKNLEQKNDLVQFMKGELQGKGAILDSVPGNSNTIYFYLNDLTSDIALALFDVNGVELSAGSACSSGAAKASAVLTYLGLEKVARNGLRISLPFEMSPPELVEIKSRISLVLERVKAK
jgi:cysteine desulfurase